MAAMGISRSQGMDIARTYAWAEHGRRHRWFFTFGGTFVRLAIFALVAAALIAAWFVTPHLILAFATGGLAAVLFATVVWRSVSMAAVKARVRGKRTGPANVMLFLAAAMLALAAVGAAMSR